MSKYSKVFFAGLLTIFISYNSLIAQVVHSPYSSIGIGDIQDPTTAAKFGMAGLGISNKTYYSLNITNPALLHYNRVALFSAAVLGERKTINQNGFEPHTVSSGQLNHIALAFPLIAGKLSTALVLNPYSVVNYEFFSNSPIEGKKTESALITSKGSGGIDQLSLSFGGILFKRLSIGIRANYMFSSIRRESKSKIAVTKPLDNNYVATVNERLSFKDFSLGLGFVYEFKINKLSSLNFGATYDFEKNLKSKLFTRLDQEIVSGATILADTIVNNIPVSVTLPQKIALGISYNYENKVIIGLDYSTQDWTQSKNLKNEDIYAKRERYVFGAEITPNARSTNKYFSRITYRVGTSYTKTPYMLSKTQISDFGINFGLSLPVVQFSSIDFGFQAGKRGTLKNELVQENYFKLYFGISFNDNRWFFQPKFN